MTGIHVALILALGATVLVWLGLSAYVIAGRTLYDLRDRSLRAAARVLGGGYTELLDPAERAATVDAILERLPRRTIERVAADASAPPWLTGPLAAFAADHGRARLLLAARSHRGELGKWRRIAALRILGQADVNAALPLLDAAIEDRDRDVRAAAVTILGGFRDQRAAERLVNALREQAHAPSRIATQLDDFPLPIADLLRPLLHDRQPIVRFWAATLLASHPGGADLDQELAALAADEDANVRAAAVETLGAIGGSTAAAVAAELLDDPVWYVRSHAARAVGRLGLVRLAGSLARMLTAEEWWVRFSAKHALEALGSRVAPALLPYLDHDDRFARNGAAEVLQNTGVLDDLLLEAAADPDDRETLELIDRIFTAGGIRLMEASIERASPEVADDVRALFETQPLGRVESA